MLKKSLSLLLALGVIIVSLGAMMVFSVMNENQREMLRHQRSDLQTLHQQFSVLQRPGISSMVTSLQTDLDALRIQLVEVLEMQPWPSGVIAVEYQHTLLPRVLVGPSSQAISMLRLELHLQVLHAIGFLDLLDHINEAIAVWPHEIRGCEIRRHHQQPLEIQCALDFYHWQSSGSAASGRSVVALPQAGSVV